MKGYCLRKRKASEMKADAVATLNNTPRTFKIKQMQYPLDGKYMLSTLRSNTNSKDVS